MGLLVPDRRFDAHEPEMIDRSDNDPVLLDQDLRNLRVINRYFGGLAAARSGFLRLLKRIPQEKVIEMLDLATGSADIPVHLTHLARRLGRQVRILAVDKNPRILDVASRITRDYPEIQLKRKDLLRLDFPDKSFDIVLCSLALHHLGTRDAVKLIREMHRLSRVGLIVNDLNRSWLGAWAAWLYTHATTRNPLTLNDSYISVLRAFTPNELRDFALEAGLSRFLVMTRLFFRLVLVAEH